MYTHRGAYRTPWPKSSMPDLRLESVYLWDLPMFHCTAGVFVEPFRCRLAHVCLGRVDPPKSSELIERETGDQFLPSAPTVLISPRQPSEARPFGHPLTSSRPGAHRRRPR